MEQAPVKVLFCDLDGTLVHYPKDLLAYADITPSASGATATVTYKHTGVSRECVALVSKTAGPSYISRRTAALITELRATGLVFVIITGARTSTYIARRPLLPPADFEFFENGGRMLARGALDPVWTDAFAAQLGPVPHRSALLPDLPPPHARDGTLWQLYREMLADGWHIDARDYTTNFRVNVAKSKGKTVEDFEAVQSAECAKRGLASSFNLGKADVYPAGSGKANAARHVLQLVGVDAAHSVAMFDDDNDLELGMLAGRSFLPGVTHPSVLEAMKTQPSWTLTEHRGVLGTEAALEEILALRKATMEGVAVAAARA